MNEAFYKAESIGLSGNDGKMEVGKELILHFFLEDSIDIVHISIKKGEVLRLLSKIAHWLENPNSNM